MQFCSVKAYGSNEYMERTTCAYTEGCLIDSLHWNNPFEYLMDEISDSFILEDLLEPKGFQEYPVNP